MSSLDNPAVSIAMQDDEYVVPATVLRVRKAIYSHEPLRT